MGTKRHGQELFSFLFIFLNVYQNGNGSKVIFTAECNTAAKKNEVDPYVLIWKGLWDTLSGTTHTHMLLSMNNMPLFVLKKIYEIIIVAMYNWPSISSNFTSQDSANCKTKIFRGKNKFQKVPKSKTGICHAPANAIYTALKKTFFPSPSHSAFRILAPRGNMEFQPLARVPYIAFIL